MSGLRVAGLTLAALAAFAGNSLLCRAALADPLIDPASFTLVRLAAGAAMLLALMAWRGRRARAADSGRAWFSAAMLFAYAAGFSFAYVSLTAATGALILFGAVQLTMFGLGLWRGERPGGWQWTGTLIAAAGLAWLLSPGLTAPALGPALLMALAGAAWGIYSLLGRGSRDPVAGTTVNFVRSLPFALLLVLPMLGRLELGWAGVGYAVASGALTSALGYVLWYAVLPQLSRIRAATVQLAVPVLVAVAGVVLLGEAITPRLLLAGALTLGGIALTLRPVPR